MEVRLIADVETAIANGDGTGRQSMLGRVTDLFAGMADRLDDDQVEAFDVVMLRLSKTVDTDGRILLAHRLADFQSAPRSVVRDLAFDIDAKVAAPVLARSTRLDEADLVAVASERGQGHLKALARRKSLSERVTDVLVVRGDDAVMEAVAANDGARFSRQGFDRIAERALTDDTLRTTLTRRSDLPSALWPRLRKPIPPTVAETGSSTETDDRSGPVTDLDEKQVVALLGAGRVADSLAALARLAEIPVQQAKEAYEDSAYEPLLYLVRAVRFGWGTFKPFLLSRPGRPLSPEEMRGAFEAFQAMSVPTARRVLHFNATKGRSGGDRPS